MNPSVAAWCPTPAHPQCTEPKRARLCMIATHSSLHSCSTRNLHQRMTHLWGFGMSLALCCGFHLSLFGLLRWALDSVWSSTRDFCALLFWHLLRSALCICAGAPHHTVLVSEYANMPGGVYLALAWRRLSQLQVESRSILICSLTSPGVKPWHTHSPCLSLDCGRDYMYLCDKPANLSASLRVEFTPEAGAITPSYPDYRSISTVFDRDGRR